MLFIHEEICLGCDKAVFCGNERLGPQFMFCVGKHELMINGINGTCPYREMDEGSTLFEEDDVRENQEI